MEQGAPHAEVGHRTTRSRTRRAWVRATARTRAVRAKVRRTPHGRLAWRVGVGLVGGVLLVAGIIMIPGPGQGWATVFLALAILSTEFAWAHRMRHGLWVRLVAAREAYERRSARRRALIAGGLVGLGFVCFLAVSWGSLVLAGVPGWVPDSAADLMAQVPGVD